MRATPCPSCGGGLGGENRGSYLDVHKKFVVRNVRIGNSPAHLLRFLSEPSTMVVVCSNCGTHCTLLTSCIEMSG